MSSATRAVTSARGQTLVHQERLGERGVDRHPRIERGERVLKNHLQVAPHGSHLGGGAGGEIAPLEDHGAAGGGHELQDGAGERGFAAAGFAHEPEHLAALDASETPSTAFTVPVCRRNTKPE
jgi:hypothetical protein